MVLMGLGACVLALVGVRTVGAQADPTDPPTTASVATTAAPATTRPPATTARPATTAPRPTTTARRATTTVRPSTTKADPESEGDGDVAILAETTVPTTVATTTVPPPETTAVPSTSAAPALEERVSESEQATTRLNRVVIGLVALAVVIAIATIVFWRLTRPRAAQAERSAAYWVDDAGAEVPLPGSEDVDGDVGRGAVAAGAAFGASAPSPDAWSVGPPPTIPTDPQDDPEPDPGAGSPLPSLSPLPARTPGAGPYPGSDDEPPAGSPVVIVEPVHAPRPTAGWSDDLRTVGDGGPDPSERSEGWASQGWGTGDGEHPEDR